MLVRNVGRAAGAEEETGRVLGCGHDEDLRLLIV